MKPKTVLEDMFGIIRKTTLFKKTLHNLSLFLLSKFAGTSF